MKKILSLVLSVLMLMGALSMFASAAEKPEGAGDVLWSAEELAGKDLNSLFTVTANKAAASPNVTYENGSLKFEGKVGLDSYDMKGVSLGLNTTVKNYTIMADVTFTGAIANNARFQLGVRPTSFAGAKTHDYYAGLMQVANYPTGSDIPTIKLQASNNITSSGSNIPLILEDTFLDDNNAARTVSYKIEVVNNKSTIYAKIAGGNWFLVGGFAQECGVADEENVLFFVVRTGHTVVVDNLVVYKGAEGEGGNEDVGGENTTIEPVYYPNGTVILNEEMLKSNLDKFAITYQNGQAKGSAAVEWNETTGRMILKGDSSANAMYRYDPFPEGLDYFTITADLYLTRNDYGKNVLIQLGYRNPDMLWGQGNLIQMYVNYDTNEGEGKDKAQMCDKGATAQTVGSTVELGTEIDIGVKVTFKIVVDDELAHYYINDTWLYSIKVSKMGNSYGDLFLATRPNVEWEIDNLMVWSGVGEPSADKTILNTQPCAAKDIPAVDDNAGDSGNAGNNDAGNTPSGDDEVEEPDRNPAPAATTAAQTTAAAKTEETTAAKEGGCGSVIAAPLMLVMFAAIVPTAMKKRKE